MNSVVLLTKLQLMQTLGGVRSAIEKRAGANGAMAGTAIVGIFVFAGVAWLGYSAYGAVGAMGLDKVVFDMLFLACGVLTFVLSLPAILSTFFGASDINDLLPLPVSPFAIAFSKALSALATSYLYTFLIIAAPLAGWGVAAGAGVGYWLAYALAVLLAPMMPVAYAGAISIIIAALFKRVRTKDAITTIATVLTLGISVATFFVSRNLDLGGNAAAALGSISEAMGGVVMAFPAYGFAVYALMHSDVLSCALFALVSLASFAVFVVVVRVLYLRIITALSSGAGKSDAYAGAGAQTQTSALKAMTLSEVRKIARNSSVALNYVAYPLLITPFTFGVIFSSDSMADFGGLVSNLGDATSAAAGIGLTLFMFLAVVSMLCNKIAGTCISREGSNWTYMKFIPVPMLTQIRAKVLPGFAVNVVIAVVFMAVGGYYLVVRMGVDAVVVVFGGILLLGASWLMTCVCAWSDTRNPNVDWGNDGDVSAKVLKRGGGLLRALLVGLVYAALPLLVSPLVGLEPRVFVPVLAAVGIAVSAVLGTVLLKAAARNVEVFE